MEEAYVQRVLQACVYDVSIESPLAAATRLSRGVGMKVYLQREDLRRRFSFRLCGA